MSMTQRTCFLSSTELITVDSFQISTSVANPLISATETRGVQIRYLFRILEEIEVSNKMKKMK